MRFLSVCSGIEAASAAWLPLGWKAVAFSEIEPFPCSVLKHHYPDVPNWGDMAQYESWPDATLDLLCGGTPCQSFSVAGLRAGLADPRGNLMLTYGAIAARYRPKWLVWENVPGVLSSNGGRDFGAFLGLLGQLGYGFAYRVLDAQYFGVAQRRRRVFVVGCFGDWRSAAAVLFERHSLSGHPAPSREARQGIAAGTLRSTDGGSDVDHVRAGHIIGPLTAACGPNGQGGSGLATDKGAEAGHILAFGGGNASDISVGTTLTHHAGRFDFESETFVAHRLRGEGFDASEDGTGRGTPLVPVPFDTMQMTSAANRSNPKPGDPCHPLAAGAHAPAIAFRDVAGAMTSNYGKQPDSSDTSLGPTLAANGMQVRRLTPRECERLQGFPDDYTAVPHRGKPAADGPRYKALGNSWAVPCARWIGQRIQSVETINQQQEIAA